jgi:hypothetical protein
VLSEYPAVNPGAPLDRSFNGEMRTACSDIEQVGRFSVIFRLARIGGVIPVMAES